MCQRVVFQICDEPAVVESSEVQSSYGKVRELQFSHKERFKVGNEFGSGGALDRDDSLWGKDFLIVGYMGGPA